MKPPSLKKNFIIYLTKTMLSVFTPLIIFPYASRVLGVDGIGSVTYAQSIASYFELLAALGLTPYAIREGTRLRDDPEALGKLVTELGIINFCTTTTAILLYAGAVFVVPGLSAYRVLLVLFTLEIFSTGMTFEWVFSILEDYAYISKRSMIFQAVDIIALFFLVRTGSDKVGYALVLMLPQLLSSITNICQMFRRVRLFRYKNYHFRPHIKGMLAVFSIVLVSSIYTLLDTTMLGAIRGDTAVGLYTAASKLTKLCIRLITAICTVFLPRLSAYRAQSDTEGFHRISLTACNIILGLAIPAAVGMFMLDRPLLTLFSGAPFLPAAACMRVFTFEFILATLDSFLAYQILVPYNEEKRLLQATATGGVIDLALNAVGIPLFGIMGAAVATLLAEVVICIMLLARSSRYVPLHMLGRNVWQYVAASVPIVGIALGSQYLLPGSLLPVAAAVALAFPLYFGLLYAIKNEYIRKYATDALVQLQKYLHRT